MLIRFDVATPPVDVELDVDVAIILQREEVLARIDDAHVRVGLDVGRRDGPRGRAGEAQYDIVGLVTQGEDEVLEVSDDEVHVLHHTSDCLVFVDDPVVQKKAQKHARRNHSVLFIFCVGGKPNAETRLNRKLAQSIADGNRG
jgi:hypothetical protein